MRIKGATVNLIQSWKESLRLFEFQNLQPFFLVTVKTCVDLYKTINRPLTAWGTWVALGVVALLVIATNMVNMMPLFGLDALILNGMRHVFFFLFLLAMRPSTGIKDMMYYRSYVEQFWLLLVMAILLGISHLYVIPLTFIWYLFSLLFVFDGAGTLRDLGRSFQNGFVMVVYNLPVCAALWAVLALIGIILYRFVGFVLGYFGGLTMAALLYIFFVPMEVALITNLYIKFIHEQSSLYFPQPKQ